MSEVLRDHLEVWNRKPVLRLVYDDFYRRIAAECIPGLTIELGGGIGNLKQRLEKSFRPMSSLRPGLIVSPTHRCCRSQTDR